MLANWSTSFPNCEPVGYRLRTAFSHRWVRFHSLSDAKRYPESELEHRVLLDRHNAVLGSLAQPGAMIILLTTVFSSAPKSEGEPLDWPESTWWRSIKVEESFWHIYAATVAWEPHRFDRVVRRVAQDATGNVLICHPNCEWVIHPYDGGMDVILDSAVSRDRIKARFRAWLSPRADGL